MADDLNFNRQQEEDGPDQFNNDQKDQSQQNVGKGPFRNSPMMNNNGGNFDPMMKMGMMNPLQYQQFQQMMMMQQFQRQQQMQRQSAMAAAAAAAAAAANSPSNIPPESQKPPTGYTCFKCGQPGHWIYYCPNVPKGQFVQRPHNRNQNLDNNNNETSASQQQKPQELCCMICEKLMTDAVLLPCCGKSFCKECITTTLEKPNSCPNCHSENVSIDQIIPNKTLRLAIEDYIQQEADNKKDQDLHTGDEEQEDNMDTREEGHSKSDEAEVKNMPIQVFDSSNEERKPQQPMRKPPVHIGFNGDNNMMMPPNPEMFGGVMPPDMSWMAANMGRPPFMNNNRFPGFAPPFMNNNNNDGDVDMDRPRPSPFMSFPGAPFNPDDNNNMFMPPPFPGMPVGPPQEMFGFNNNMPYRGGFNMRGGRGRGRGGFHHNNNHQNTRRRSDFNNHHNNDQDNKKTDGEVIPTGPRSESRYNNRRSSRSRSPRGRSERRDDSRRDESRRSDRRGRDRDDRHDDRRERDREDRRDDDTRRDRDDRRDDERRDDRRSDDKDKRDDKHSSSRRRSRSPKDERSSSNHRSSRSHHTSSKHHSSRSRYRSRDRSDRSRDRSERGGERSERGGDRSDRDKPREKSRERSERKRHERR